MRARFLLLALVAAATSLSAQSQVTWDRLLHADREPHNWLSYSATSRWHRLWRLTAGNPLRGRAAL